MTDAEIFAGLGKRLAAISGLPTVVWPNRDAAATPPYIVAQFVPISRFDETFAGGATVARGFATFTVVTEIDAYETAAQTIGETIAAQFPYGLRLTEGATSITITTPPRMAQGYRDGAKWRAPVRVDYDAI